MKIQIKELNENGTFFFNLCVKFQTTEALFSALSCFPEIFPVLSPPPSA